MLLNIIPITIVCMKDISEIYEEMTIKPKIKEKKLLQKGYDRALESHKDQKRASGEPYFNHVFETAKNLAYFGLDATTIAAGFLHDTIEDTDITEEDIQKEFGDEIVFLVNGVKLQGVITWFDNFCVLLRRDGASQLVYKHAISTIMPSQPVQLYDSEDNS